MKNELREPVQRRSFPQNNSVKLSIIRLYIKAECYFRSYFYVFILHIVPIFLHISVKILTDILIIDNIHKICEYFHRTYVSAGQTMCPELSAILL